MLAELKILNNESGMYQFLSGYSSLILQGFEWVLDVVKGNWSGCSGPIRQKSGGQQGNLNRVRLILYRVAGKILSRQICK